MSAVELSSKHLTTSQETDNIELLTAPGEPGLDTHTTEDAKTERPAIDVRSRNSRPPRKQTISTWPAAFLSDWWILELLGAIFSAAALIGAAVILGRNNGRLLEYLSLPITLNTMISILSITSKAAMTFALAQALSQLKWTTFYRKRRALLGFQYIDAASRGPLGALNLLLGHRTSLLACLGALATLLLLGVEPFLQQAITCPNRNVNVGATLMPRAQSYNMTVWGIGGPADPDPLVKVAIYNGIFGSGSSRTQQALSVSCPTGNCTFPTHASLGVCSKCVNVTSSIKQADCGNIYRICTPTMSDGLSLVLQPDGGMPSINMSTRPTEWLVVTQISAIGFPRGHLSPVGGQPGLGALAYECTLSICVKVYESNEMHGNLTEEVKATFADPGPANTSSNSATIVLPPSTKIQDLDPVFGVDQPTISYLGIYFDPKLTGAITSGDSFFKGSDLIEVFYTNGIDNIGDTMSSFATSLTNYIRSAGTGTPVQGTAWTLKPYIHVRWAWFLLPFALWALSSVVLLVTVFQSRVRVPIWKASVTAVMLHGIEKHGNEDVITLRKISEIENCLCKREVQLKRTDVGFYFLG